jgi:DNA polymerase-1
MRTELGRLIRKVFVPKESCVFTDADYSQIELRILAHMSEDQGLISAYHEGDDIHRITASKVFHVPFEEVTPLQRRNAKAVNFGIVYGMSNYGLSQDLSISVSEAKEYMSKYFDTYPGVKVYQDRVIQEAKNKGYSETLFGRRRPIPELKASNFMMRQFGERVAMNAPIQGTAADIIKVAMIHIFQRFKAEGIRSKMLLQVHDELNFSVYPEEKEKVERIVLEEMQSAFPLSVPLVADSGFGQNWLEAH